jgi:hypothetical protein
VSELIDSAAVLLVATSKNEEPSADAVKRFQVAWNIAAVEFGGNLLNEDGVYGPEVSKAITSLNLPAPSQVEYGGAWTGTVPSYNPYANASMGDDNPDAGGGGADFGPAPNPVPAPSSPPSGDHEVAKVATPTSAQDLTNLFAGILGSSVPQAAVAVLVAQAAFETGNFKALYNWNFGNAKYTGGTNWFLQMDDCKDSSGNKVPCKFRSYDDAARGAQAYLHLLQTVYPESWAAALQGDVAGFVKGLVQNAKGLKYFSSSNVAGYEAGVQKYWNQFKNLLPSVQDLKDDAQIVINTVEDNALGGFALVAGLGLLAAWLLARNKS